MTRLAIDKRSGRPYLADHKDQNISRASCCSKAHTESLRVEKTRGERGAIQALPPGKLTERAS